jgi:Cu+-exporting ATPase
MNPNDWIVLAASAAFLGLFYWWFFFSKRDEVVAATATAGGVQEVTITVKGGYSPDHVTVRPGQAVRLNFRREESGECTDRVVIPAFKVNKPLPAFATTPIEFTPTQPGDFDFSCGMGMVHGKITVTEPG